MEILRTVAFSQPLSQASMLRQNTPQLLPLMMISHVSNAGLKRPMAGGSRCPSTARVHTVPVVIQTPAAWELRDQLCKKASHDTPTALILPLV